jgi:hypothetical protein
VCLLLLLLLLLFFTLIWPIQRRLEQTICVERGRGGTARY